VVITVEAASVENSSLLDYLTSNVEPEDPEFRRTDPNIQIDNNCMDDQLHIGMLERSGNHEEEGDECDEHDAISTANTSQWPTTELDKIDQGTIGHDGYEGEHANDADEDAHEVQDASQADDGSTQNLED
jgi:hypothetical protein